MPENIIALWFETAAEQERVLLAVPKLMIPVRWIHFQRGRLLSHSPDLAPFAETLAPGFTKKKKKKATKVDCLIVFFLVFFHSYAAGYLVV